MFATILMFILSVILAFVMYFLITYIFSLIVAFLESVFGLLSWLLGLALQLCFFAVLCFFAFWLISALV